MNPPINTDWVYHSESRVFLCRLDLNPYLAMLVGCVITVIIQSSSITTSTLVPLVGHGAITLEQMFPTTLGMSSLGVYTRFLCRCAQKGRKPLSMFLTLCLKTIPRVFTTLNTTGNRSRERKFGITGSHFR